jgi:hypothetical protein
MQIGEWVLKGNIGPKMTMWRGVIWPRDSLFPGGRGRQQREPRERGEGTVA